MKYGFWLAGLFLAGAVQVAGASAGSEPRPTRVVASFYPIYVATLNVARDIPGLEVTNLTSPSVGCLHHYNLTPGDIRTLAQADILVVNGGCMENFIGRVASELPALAVIDASAGLTLLDDPLVEEEVRQAQLAQGLQPGNPHVWVSLRGAIAQVRTIAARLAELRPEYAEALAANAARYVARLEELRGRMHARLGGLAARRIVTFHDAFPYFADEFGLTIVAVVQREAGSQPSARELAETIEVVRKFNVAAIFAEPQYPRHAADVIARETGRPVSLLDPAVTGPVERPAVYDAYLAAMERNLLALEQSLQPADPGA